MIYRNFFPTRIVLGLEDIMICQAEYEFSESFEVTDNVKKKFNDLGYIVLRGVLDKEEVNMVMTTLQGSNSLMQNNYEVDLINPAKRTKIIMWRHPGDDVTGMVARSEKIAGTCEKLLGGEVYHYHSKMLLKDANLGHQHHWHQDYGYWYKNGCLFPDMMTVFIALDPCKKENGCLQILPGSHKCGRISHHPVKHQLEADLERVAQIKKTCPILYAELEPGDALFFHSNVLHHSEDNNSDMRRWAYLCCYNRASNNPTKEHHHPRYTPLHKVPNSAIKECTNFTDMSGKDFNDPKKNKSQLDHIKS